MSGYYYVRIEVNGQWVTVSRPGSLPSERMALEWADCLDDSFPRSIWYQDE